MTRKEKRMFRGRVNRIHFIGIGGIGMSGIAELLLNLGYEVSGSDLRESRTTKRLVKRGARVMTGGHRPENLGDSDVVVVSSAIAGINPEIEEARKRGVPVIPRAEMLAELMRLKHGVAVAGSHGKTTTTSLIAAVLAEAGLDPTIVNGGRLNAIGSNSHLGQGELLVAEADESDGSFMHLSPTLAVVTNIDPEHLDHYGSLRNLENTFVEFVNKIPFYGIAVLCLDHPNVQSILPRVEKRYVTYGLSPQADYRATDLHPGALEAGFTLKKSGSTLGEVSITMPGIHNVLNALAAFAVCDELGVPFDAYAKALAEFKGVQRRFTVMGESGGVMVVDDYAHHPAEIRATLEAAQRGLGRRVVAVFQPHRYSRVRTLYDDFLTSFNRADVLVVTGIYAAGEEADESISGQRLAQDIEKYGHKHVIFENDMDRITDVLLGIVEKNDVVITLGAGNINRMGRDLLNRLKETEDK